ncbi:MAG TPA: tetratricopeptide repeat protein [Terriglobia bacterium]|nr:tetratricopeptide repeat protein [Terriglobia bacterium]
MLWRRFLKNHLAVVLLLTLSAAVPSVAQANGQGQQAALAHLVQAKKFLAQKDLSRAKAEIESAVQADPTYGEAYELLGEVEFQSGNTAGAISAFNHAVKLLPKSFSSHYGLGMAFLRNSQAADGLQELRAAVALRPNDVDANYNLGVVLLDQGQPIEAIDHLRKAQAPGDIRPEVAYNLVRAELAANRLDEARNEARKAAGPLESDFKWQASIGQLFLEHHQPGDAVSYLSRAHALQPDSSEVRHALAAACLQSNQPQQAITLIKEPAAAEDYYLLAGANYLLRQYALAAKDAAMAISMDAGQPQYLLLSARIDQHLGRHDSALSLLEKAIKLAPKWPDPYYSAGVSLYCEKRYPEARKYLAESLKLQPDSARALFLVAVSLASEGEYQEAENNLREAVELSPANAHFRYYLGEILMRQNRLADAEQVYRQAIRVDPKYAPLHYQLGKLLLRSHHPDLAAQETEKAISLDPNLAEAYYQLVQAYNRLGNKEKSARAAAAFAKLKTQPISDKDVFYDSVKKDLGLP